MGPELIEYRKKLMGQESPKTLRQLLRKLTAPKGVRRTAEGHQPWDEGIVLFTKEILWKKKATVSKKNSKKKEKV